MGIQQAISMKLSLVLVGTFLVLAFAKAAQRLATKAASVAQATSAMPTCRPGMNVQLRQPHHGHYLHSNFPEGGGMSLGPKRTELGFNMWWQGKLRDGTTVQFESRAPQNAGKFLHSNGGSRASWGGAAEDYAWRIEY